MREIIYSFLCVPCWFIHLCLFSTLTDFQNVYTSYISHYNNNVKTKKNNKTVVCFYHFRDILKGVLVQVYIIELSIVNWNSITHTILIYIIVFKTLDRT